METQNTNQNKTQDSILELIAKNPGISDKGIKNKLDKKGKSIIYSTLTKYLDKMVSNNKLTAESKCRIINPGFEDSNVHYVKHYFVNNNGSNTQ